MDYIVLAPSTKVLPPDAREHREGAERKKRLPIHREYLDLRFEFHSRITDETFEDTAKILRSLIKESKTKTARINFIAKRGGSRWPPILNVVRAAVRLRKRPKQYSRSRASSNGIAVQVEPLASLLNTQLAASAQGIRRSAYLAPAPAVNGVTANGRFSYPVAGSHWADVVCSFLRRD
jgi:hypothetical protein